MIITRAPFRISLGGGGTDLPSFYEKNEGFVFNLAIDKYIYIHLKPSILEQEIKIKYSKNECVEKLSELKHTRAKEALDLYGIRKAVEITSIADLPSSSGLGSSSSYLTALLTALAVYTRKPCYPHRIAEQACEIEIGRLKEPIGKQDQYIAAYGGLTTLDIKNSGEVKVNKVKLSVNSLHTFLGNAHVYYTGLQRSASDILEEQDRKTKENSGGAVESSLLKIKELGHEIYEEIIKENFDNFGLLLDKHWQTKKNLSKKVAVPQIEKLYEEAKEKYGVLGGKLIGAGGGGFLMLYCHKRHRLLENFMKLHGMPRLDYFIDFQGTKVVADLRASHELNINHI